jgi:hypothetical protein
LFEVNGKVSTVTPQYAVKEPSLVVTVIAALPTLTPVTRPVWLTVATDGSLVAHVTAGFAAFGGLTVAVNWMVFPTPQYAEASTLTPVTEEPSDTVTKHVAV